MPTGIFMLDYVLDGGIYRGEGGHRIELYGKESSGKTTVALYIVKKFIEKGLKVMFVNAEKSYDKTWAEILGIDNSKVYIAEPETLEQTGDMMVQFLNEYDLVVVDSIPSLITREELEGTMEENKYMATQAKVMSPMMRKLYSAIKDSYCTQLYINQLREKVGVMYGNPIDTPGGRALKHYYNTRLEFKVSEPIEEGTGDNKERIGNVVAVKCVKNKRGKPYRVGVFDLYYNGFIDNSKSLIYQAIKFGLIQRGGAWYQFKRPDGTEIKEQGIDNLKVVLTPEDYKYIEQEVWKNIK